MLFLGFTSIDRFVRHRDSLVLLTQEICLFVLAAGIEFYDKRAVKERENEILSVNIVCIKSRVAGPYLYLSLISNLTLALAINEGIEASLDNRYGIRESYLLKRR